MIADVEGFPGYWCGSCRGPLGCIEPSSTTRCRRCGEYAWPLDERLQVVLIEAGFDEEDAALAVEAVLPLYPSPSATTTDEPTPRPEDEKGQEPA